MTLPFVSVVVITKNNAKTIEECIKSLINQTFPREKYEIIFVDGQSVDGTDKTIHNYVQHHDFVKLFYEEQGTMGYARNLGVKKSKGEIIAFIDADAVAPENWLMCIVDRFREKNIVALGGLDILVSESKSSKAIDSWRRMERKVGVKAIPHIKTVNFAIRRDSLVMCGSFDSSLSHLDETELLARFYAKTKTNGILYDPEIVVYHKRAQSIDFSKRIKKTFTKSAISVPILLRKYMIRVAIANLSSPIATSFYLIFVCVLGLPIFLLSLLLGKFIQFFVSVILLYIAILGIYVFLMFLNKQKVVISIPLVLTVDVIARLAGTFFGLIKLPLTIIKRYKSKSLIGDVSL